jgi:ribonuclease BN (tRNA processing enzyme)
LLALVSITPGACPQDNAPGRFSPTARFGFVPLGIGDLFSSIHYPTSLLVLAGDERLLIDCPSPLLRMLHDASVKSAIPIRIEDIRHVILTHLHGDHAGGLECLGFYGRFNSHQRPNLWTLPEIAADLWEHRLSGSMAYDIADDFSIEKRYQLEDFFQLHELGPDRPTQVANVTVHVRRTRHAPSCFGLKILFNGRWLGYSSDTSYDPQHIAFLEECDVIIHETGRKIHTAYESLVALPEPIRRKLRLIHIEDSLATASLELPVLEEGKFYTVER